MRERLRTLHHDDRRFTWRAEIRSAPPGGGRRRRFIRVRVWGAGKNSCVLEADVATLPDPGTTEETYAYPSAAIVLRLVTWALAAGWDPDAVGGTFRVSPLAGPPLPGLAPARPDLTSTVP